MPVWRAPDTRFPAISGPRPPLAPCTSRACGCVDRSARGKDLGPAAAPVSVAAVQRISARGHAEPPPWNAAANASAPVRNATPPRTAWLGVALLLALAPFERLQALVRLPGQQVTNVEALLFAVLAAWALALSFRSTGRSTGRAPGRALAALVSAPLTAPWIALILAMLLAAVVAPSGESLEGNALNMVGRYGLAFLVYILAVDATSSGRLDHLLAVAVVLGFVLAVIILLDFWGLSGVRAWLRQFRTGISLVGSQVRATGPFQYPTIASMYLEVLFALGLGFLLLMLERGRHGAAAMVVLTLLLIGQAVVLTFTRAGLVTLLSSLAIVAALRVRERGLDRTVLVLAGLALAIGLQFVASRSLDALRLRLSTEGQEEWYRASFDAPLEIDVPCVGHGFVRFWPGDGEHRARARYSAL